MKNIPLVDLKAQYFEIKDELNKAWEEILNGMNLYLGPNVQSFEKEFAKYLNVKECIGVDNGTDALCVAIRAAGIKPGTKIITVSHTFFATVESIWLVGCEQILIDIDEKNYNISIEELKKYIEENTKFSGGRLIDKDGKVISAIMPVHLYGQPAEMDEIMKIAKKYNLIVIEDASQAQGAEYKGKKVGSIGDITGMSFYFSKNLGAFGEAGCVTTNNEEYAKNVKLIRVHGQIDKYTHDLYGYNTRLDELQAAVLRIKLKRLDKWNERRIKIAEIYKENLKDLPLVLPEKAKDVKHVYHLFVVRSEKRDELGDYLKKNGVGVGVHYPIPCHLQKPLKDKNFKLPVTEKVAKEVLSLPIYPHLSDDDVLYVCDKIKEFFKGVK